MSQIQLPLYLRGEEQLCQILDELLEQARVKNNELEWIEFKCDFRQPRFIGEYISALSNSSALCAQTKGWMIWGIEDVNHQIVGTSFVPTSTKGKGNEDLESWLTRLLDPHVHFCFHEFNYGDKSVVVLEVEACQFRPVRFDGVEYIRIGSYKKQLSHHPEKESKLWALFNRTPFESGVALERADEEEILQLLDYASFFKMSKYAFPEGRKGIIDRLAQEKFITRTVGGKYNISNLGAILFANDLNQFETLKRKQLRIITNKGLNRVEPSHERLVKSGYASAFADTIQYISDQTPPNEVIGNTLRSEQKMYPPVAIRELLVNALGHQDFSISGAGPIVEIFSNRIEFSNPGLPLIEILRFINPSPLSRNEGLAAMMRLLNMCEERGSGITRVISLVEIFQLPPPEWRVDSSHTLAFLFAHRTAMPMERSERIRACYQHTCLMHASRQAATNTTIRKRFNIAAGNHAQASRILKETIEAGLIKPADSENRSSRMASYVPIWA